MERVVGDDGGFVFGDRCWVMCLSWRASFLLGVRSSTTKIPEIYFVPPTPPHPENSAQMGKCGKSERHILHICSSSRKMYKPYC